MASALYNRGKKILSDASLAWTGAGDFRVLLVTSSYTPNVDHNTVSQITNELSGGGYARVALSGKSGPTQDDANDRVSFDASDATFVTLGAAAGTPAYAIVYKYNAADASAELVGYFALTTPPTPNGGDYTIVWPTVGLFTLT